MAELSALTRRDYRQWATDLLSLWVQMPSTLRGMVSGDMVDALTDLVEMAQEGSGETCSLYLIDYGEEATLPSIWEEVPYKGSPSSTGLRVTCGRRSLDGAIWTLLIEAGHLRYIRSPLGRASLSEAGLDWVRQLIHGYGGRPPKASK